MLFETAEAFRQWPQKAITVFGMSGVGKTMLASMLRQHDWYHYSVDYRIGTRYMGEHIANSYKHAAMNIPLFEGLLKSDSMRISPKMGFHNLTPLTTYLGRPGDCTRGGLPLVEYIRRQRYHRRAEINALLDVPDFIETARKVYGYDHFICDSGGSICEVVNPDDSEDPVLRTLCQNSLLLHIRGGSGHAEILIKRFRTAPKPMYFNENILQNAWQEFKTLHNITNNDTVDPDAFAIFGFERLLEHRLPLYDRIAELYGYTLSPQDMEGIATPGDFVERVTGAIEARLTAPGGS